MPSSINSNISGPGTGSPAEPGYTDAASPSLPAGLTDPAAESDLIGGLLRTPALVAPVVERVDSDTAFTSQRHGAAYRAILAAFSGGHDVSVPRVRDLMRTGGDTDPKLATWLSDLYTGAPLLRGDILGAAQRVQSLAKKRGMETQLLKSLVQVRDVSVTDRDAIDAIHAAMTSLLVDAPIGEALHPGQQVLLDTIDRIEEAGRQEGLPGLSTGSRDLDETLQGLRPGQLVIVGARPAVGKSIMATDLVRAAVKQNVGTLLFTLEMTRFDVSKRILSAEARVDSRRVISGKLDDTEWERLSKAVNEFPADMLTIVDQVPLTVAQIAALATQQARMWEAAGIKPGLIGIDYLQLIAQTRGSDSRQVAIGQITRELKTLAKRLEVPVVALAQLNRDAAGKAPVSSELRESGDIEADADIIILLHRPDQSDPEDRPGEIDLIIDKNREGATKTITRTHLYRYSKIEDIAHGAA